MKIVGIAGQSGTGKTTISGHLASRGGVHINADRVGHDALTEDEEVIAAVREIAGDAVFGRDGKIDRTRLGAVVFNDETLLARYNAVIHPAIRRRCGRLVEEARAAGAPFVVVDAALLLDTAMPFTFDLMIALRVDEDEQIRRLLEKGGWTEKQVRERLDNQHHITEALPRADVVVDTSRPLAEVLEEIDRLVDDLLAS